MSTHSKKTTKQTSGREGGNSYFEWIKKSPSDTFRELYKQTIGRDKLAGTVLATTLVTCFLCYFYEMIYGLGCPDTLCEGVHFYRNADYSTSQARWMLRFINELAGKNVIMPVITVLLYCLMIGIGTYFICRMTNLTKTLPVILLTATMVSFPVVLHHFAFLYMALAYSFSFLMTVLAIRLIRSDSVSGFIAATFCLLMMMGSYQAYIGAVSALAFVLLISDAIRAESLKKSFIHFGLTAASGALAAGINMPFSRLMMRLFHTGVDERVDAFSVKSIFENIGFSLTYSYKWFFSYFQSDVLSRNRFYTVIFLILAVLTVIVVIRKFKEKSIGRAITILVTTLLLPLAMNLLLIIMPTNGMRDILRYQYVLIFVLLFVLHSSLEGRIYNHIMEYVTILATVMLLIANVISANSTAFMYKFTYDYAVQQGQQMMNRIYDMDDYVANETPIILGGPISYAIVQERYPKIFRFAEKEGGPVFWENVYGMVSCRYHFFLDFLGVNPVYISNQEYLDAVTSEEYQAMPKWPEPGSIQMIDDHVVIKIFENPPLN